MVEFEKAVPGGTFIALRRSGRHMRKLIEFDDETWNALKLLATDRMGTLQELADEAFADLLEKHGRPVDLRKALRASVKATGKKADHASDKKNVVTLAAKRKTKK
jgi:hypothetical protein